MAAKIIPDTFDTTMLLLHIHKDITISLDLLTLPKFFLWQMTEDDTLANSNIYIHVYMSACRMETPFVLARACLTCHGWTVM